jgi:hypothetical protein
MRPRFAITSLVEKIQLARMWTPLSRCLAIKAMQSDVRNERQQSDTYHEGRLRFAAHEKPPEDLEKRAECEYELHVPAESSRPRLHRRCLSYGIETDMGRRHPTYRHPHDVRLQAGNALCRGRDRFLSDGPRWQRYFGGDGDTRDGDHFMMTYSSPEWTLKNPASPGTMMGPGNYQGAETWQTTVTGMNSLMGPGNYTSTYQAQALETVTTPMGTFTNVLHVRELRGSDYVRDVWYAQRYTGNGPTSGRWSRATASRSACPTRQPARVPPERCQSTAPGISSRTATIATR